MTRRGWNSAERKINGGTDFALGALTIESRMGLLSGVPNMTLPKQDSHDGPVLAAKIESVSASIERHILFHQMHGDGDVEFWRDPAASSLPRGAVFDLLRPIA
jgi:hypothetical protein